MPTRAVIITLGDLNAVRADWDGSDNSGGGHSGEQGGNDGDEFDHVEM